MVGVSHGVRGGVRATCLGTCTLPVESEVLRKASESTKETGAIAAHISPLAKGRASRPHMQRAASPAVEPSTAFGRPVLPEVYIR